jgi:hypothetical protein
MGPENPAGFQVQSTIHYTPSVLAEKTNFGLLGMKSQLQMLKHVADNSTQSTPLCILNKKMNLSLSGQQGRK